MRSSSDRVLVKSEWRESNPAIFCLKDWVMNDKLVMNAVVILVYFVIAFGYHVRFLSENHRNLEQNQYPTWQCYIMASIWPLCSIMDILTYFQFRNSYLVVINENKHPNQRAEAIEWLISNGIEHWRECFTIYGFYMGIEMAREEDAALLKLRFGE